MVRMHQQGPLVVYSLRIMGRLWVSYVYKRNGHDAGLDTGYVNVFIIPTTIMKAKLAAEFDFIRRFDHRVKTVSPFAARRFVCVYMYRSQRRWSC
jgi:hypothetical protein